MENIELILSVAGTALGLLITTVTFLTKFIKELKAKNSENALKLMTEFAQTVVQEVEVVKSKANGELDGTTKKAMALTRFNQLCIDNGIPFNATKAGELIEKVVALTKVVNARDKDVSGGI